MPSRRQRSALSTWAVLRAPNSVLPTDGFDTVHAPARYAIDSPSSAAFARSRSTTRKLRSEK